VRLSFLCLGLCGLVLCGLRRDGRGPRNRLRRRDLVFLRSTELDSGVEGGLRHTREVMSPKGSDFILSAYVPYIEFCILIRDCLYIETHSRDGGYVLF